jgi:hypothetical protein
MMKGLKIAMIAWAVIGILFGLAFLFFPNQMGAGFGLSQVPTYVQYFLALLGNMYIVTSICVILATRDPLKHILWVQLAITGSLMDMIASLVFIIRGSLTFSQGGDNLIINIILVPALLIFYPWRRKQAG